MKRYLLSILLLLGNAMCAQNLGGSANPLTGKVKPGEIGSHLPEFFVNDLRGHPISSDNLKGKVVIIDFWATWCGPCKQEMPGYQKLVDHFGSQGLVVIGFKSSAMADTDDALKFAKKIGVHYPLAVSSDGLEQRFGGIEGLPTTLIYDRQGVLRKKVIGFEYTDTIRTELLQLF